MTALVVRLALAGGIDARQEDRPCAADPDYLYIDDNTAEDKADRAWIKDRLCGPCPLRLDCLRAALEVDERQGVWGGIDFKWERYLLPRAIAELEAIDSNMPVKRPA